MEVLLCLLVCDHVEHDGTLHSDPGAFPCEDALYSLQHAQDLSWDHAAVIVIVAELEHHYHKR